MCNRETKFKYIGGANCHAHRVKTNTEPKYFQNININQNNENDYDGKNMNENRYSNISDHNKNDSNNDNDNDDNKSNNRSDNDDNNNNNDDNDYHIINDDNDKNENNDMHIDTNDDESSAYSVISNMSNISLKIKNSILQKIKNLMDDKFGDDVYLHEISKNEKRDKILKHFKPSIPVNKEKKKKKNLNVMYSNEITDPIIGICIHINKCLILKYI